MLCAVVFYTSSSKDFQSLPEVVWKNTASIATNTVSIAILDNGLLQKAMSYLHFTVCKFIEY